MAFFEDHGPIDWEDIAVHAAVSFMVGVLTGGLNVLINLVHFGWLVREIIQRVQKKQSWTHLFRGRQVLLEWTVPLVTGMTGYLITPVYPILYFYRIFVGS